MTKKTLLTSVMFLFLTLFYVGANAQETFTFTNCGATGQYGPTQVDVDAEYVGTNLEGDVTINTQGFQEWTVPFTSDYRIQAVGAQGGGEFPGAGADITGDFISLEAGTVLRIVVGQQGTTTDNTHGSGGGGTFVVDADDNIYVIAGGGGGKGKNVTVVQPVAHGTTSEDGQSPTGGGPGGTLGGGGAAASGDYGGTNLIPGDDASGSTWASGGGGFYTNGGGMNSGSTPGGVSFLNGAIGGDESSNAPGGFGGGGGVGDRGAGGGGYSGGGAGENNSESGGGGGSFNAGTNQVNIGGVNSGHGYVVITKLCNPLTITTTPDQTIYCPGSEITLTATSENTGSVFTWTGGVTNGTPFVVNETTTYTVTSDDIDDCPTEVTITIDDVEAPVAPVLDPVYIDCGGMVYSPTATDACEGDIEGVTGDDTEFILPGTYYIDWYFEDSFGNYTQTTQEVIVEDYSAPIVIGQDIEIMIDENYEAMIEDYTIFYTATASSTIWMYDGANNLLYDDSDNYQWGPVGVEYVEENGMLYWGAGNEHYIYYAAADGTYTQTVALDNSNEGSEHHDLAIDYANNRYFFTSGSGGIWVADLDDVNPATSLNDIEAIGCTSLRYESETDMIYFNNDDTDGIYRMNADGTGAELLYDNADGVDRPRGVAIDTLNSRIFWVNKGSNNIMMGSLDGTYSATVVYEDVAEQTAYEIVYEPMNDEIFWTTFTGNSTTQLYGNDVIYKAPADGSGEPMPIIQGHFGGIRGLYVIPTENLTVNDWSYDECSGIADLTYSQTEFTCDDAGENVVEITATDYFGNIATYTATVTVYEDELPTITECVEDQVIDLAQGETYYEVVGMEFDPTAEDNCGLVILENDYNDMETLAGEQITPGTYSITWTVADASGNEVDCSFSLTVNDYVGVNDITDANISIYPNPTSGQFVVSNAEGFNLTITDLTGKTLSQEVISTSKHNVSINLASGVYMINLTSGSQNYASKLIVE